MSDLEWGGANGGKAAVRPDEPNSDDEGLVVRPIFSSPVIVVEESACTTTVTSIPANLVAVPLAPANSTRIGFSIRNTSTTDTLYVLISATGTVTPAFHSVALRPTAYYEDPYRYLGLVTGVWSPAATGAADVTEYIGCSTGGNTGNPQRFLYVATGLEGDSFDITLPATRANTSYIAEVTGGGLAFMFTFDCPVNLYTTTQIHVNSSGVLTAGDVLIVEVEDLT